MLNLEILVVGSRSFNIKKNPYIQGKIKINDFEEEFDIPIDWWSISDYQLQWNAGLERIKNHSQSCLVTRIRNPNKGPFIDWWLLYKESDRIYIRNEVLFGDEYNQVIGSREFTASSCYDFIPPRGPRILENGMQVSEWMIRLDQEE